MMRLYAGKQGQKAINTFGIIEGEAVVGGRMKDATANAKWRTVGTSPELYPSAMKGSSDGEPGKELVVEENAEKEASKGEKDSEEEEKEKKEETEDKQQKGDFPADEKLVEETTYLGDTVQEDNASAHKPVAEKREDLNMEKTKSRRLNLGKTEWRLTSTVTAPESERGQEQKNAGEDDQVQSETSGPGWRKEVLTADDFLVQLPPSVIPGGEGGLEVPDIKLRDDFVTETVPPKREIKLRALPMIKKPEEKLLDSELDGFVAIKLGDPPEARRMRLRTSIKMLDGRRLAWEDQESRSQILDKVNHDLENRKTFDGAKTTTERSELSSAHLSLVSIDCFKVHDAELVGEVYFEGNMRSTPLPFPVGPNGEIRYRQQQLKLVGIDGTLSTSQLKLNDLLYDQRLTGSFFLNDDAMKIDLSDGNQNFNRFKVHSMSNGQSSLHIAHKGTFLKATVNARSKSMFLQASQFSLHTLLGSGIEIGGNLNASVSLNIGTRRGNASVEWKKLRVGDTALESFESKLR